MRRVRWLGAQWPIPIRVLASRMKMKLFQPDGLNGFVIERVRDDEIEAFFIEKLMSEEVVTDPFGNDTIYKRLSYRKLSFSLFADFPNIELRDPHRSTRVFINKLTELCDFLVVVEPLSVDLLRWASDIEFGTDTLATIDTLQASGIEVEKGVKATMLLKGDGDVSSAFKTLATTRKPSVDKLQLRMPNGNKFSRVGLSRFASAQITDDVWRELLPALRRSLANQKTAKE